MTAHFVLIGGGSLIAAAVSVAFVDDVGSGEVVLAPDTEPTLTPQLSVQPVPSEGLIGDPRPGT